MELQRLGILCEGLYRNPIAKDINIIFDIRFLLDAEVAWQTTFDPVCLLDAFQFGLVN